MTAQELKQVSFKSVNKEVTQIEALMKREAEKGELKLLIDKISDAARIYFVEKGFKYKIHLEPNKEIGTSNKVIFSWE